MALSDNPRALMGDCQHNLLGNMPLTIHSMDMHGVHNCFTLGTDVLATDRRAGHGLVPRCGGVPGGMAI